MATYGFDGDSKGRVPVYSKSDADYEINKKNVDLYLNDPQISSGSKTIYTLPYCSFPAIIHPGINSSNIYYITFNIPLCLSSRYTNVDVELDANFFRIWTNDDLHVFSGSTEIKSFVNNIDLYADLPFAGIALEDPSGANFGMSSSELTNNKLCMVDFDELKLTCTSQGYRRTQNW